MVNPDWSLGRAQLPQAQDYLNAFESGRIRQVRENTRDAVRDGNFQDAARYAASEGDLEYAQSLGVLNDAELKRAAAKLDHAASVAWGLRNVEPARRTAIYERARGGLKSFGWTDDDLDSIDVTSDDELDSLINQGLTLKDQIETDLRDRQIKAQMANAEATRELTQANRDRNFALQRERLDWEKGQPDIQLVKEEWYNPETGLSEVRSIPIDRRTGQVYTGGNVPASTPAEVEAPSNTGGSAPAPSKPRASSDQLASMVRSFIPGVTVTSGKRTPQRNAEVGGVPNSQHIAGTAIDILPPRGMTPAQVKAGFAARGVDVDVIDEGDHYHIQGARGTTRRTPAPVAQAQETRRQAQVSDGRPGVVVGVRKPPASPRGPTTYRTATPEELRGYPTGTVAQIDSNGKLVNLKIPDTKGRAPDGGKPLPSTQEKIITQENDTLSALIRATSTFRDEYAGNTITGDAENMIQGLFGGFGSPGQRDWWAAWRETDNVIRNGLFGSALTPSEKAAYAGTTINPFMDPAEVRRNITRRLEIAKIGVKRLRETALANGYSRDAVDAAIGSSNAEIYKGIINVTSVDQVRRLPSGTVYQTPDGKRYRKD